MKQYAVNVKVSGVVLVAAGAITRTIDCGAVPFWAGPEFSMFILVVAGPAIVVVQVCDQIATGVVATLAGAVAG